MQISLFPILLQESTPAGYHRAFAEVASERSDPIIVHARGELLRQRQLIVELAEKTRLPAIYLWLEYVDAGGLMAYASDFREFARCSLVTSMRSSTEPSRAILPIYLSTKYELVINLKAAKAIDFTIPPVLLVATEK